MFKIFFTSSCIFLLKAKSILKILSIPLRWLFLLLTYLEELKQEKYKKLLQVRMNGKKEYFKF